MEITKNLFDVLTLFTSSEEELSIETIQKKCFLNLAEVKVALAQLQEAKYVENGKISHAGLEALEPFRVKKAIFLAAGFGSRLIPVTLNTPKPLVRVNGIRIIDRLLDACLRSGITEIYVVRGYLSEQFDQLLYKYPMIKFLENPFYNESNNISSAMVARYLMQNAYVFESDLLLANPDLISPYQYRSSVLGIWKERTDDWCLTEKDGFVDEEKIGGLNCWQMVGIYYFDVIDGIKLAEDLKKAYEMPGGKELYWETVVNRVNHGKYKILIRSCKEQDIVEIDTFRELVAIDKSYAV